VCEQPAQLEHGDIVVVQRKLTPTQAAAARFPSAIEFMASKGAAFGAGVAASAAAHTAAMLKADRR
jgi:hypothetical protein